MPALMRSGLTRPLGLVAPGSGGGMGRALLSVLLAALMGELQAVALADGSGQAHGWLQVCSMSVLSCMLYTQHQSASVAGLRPAAWRSFALGWCYALGGLCATFWWLYVSMHV